MHLFVHSGPQPVGAEGVSMPYLRLTCPSLPAARRRQIAGELTDLLVELFTPPSDFAVGGALLSRRVPRAARLAKRLLG
jgi:hypothetical protein